MSLILLIPSTESTCGQSSNANAELWKGSLRRCAVPERPIFPNCQIGGEKKAMTLIQKRQRKNPHAVALGRAGGRNSRKYMTIEHASELGRRSVEVREYQRLA